LEQDCLEAGGLQVMRYDILKGGVLPQHPLVIDSTLVAVPVFNQYGHYFEYSPSFPPFLTTELFFEAQDAG
jgi:hypothetical protein